MISQISQNILRFLILVLLQIFVLNNVQYTIGINPYLYILFLIMLPFEIPNWALLFIAFATGIVVDVFSDSMGIHTASCLLLALFRPYMLKTVTPYDGYKVNTFPSIKHYGLDWFVKYVSLLIIIHHAGIIFCDAFSFHDFFRSLWLILSSSILTFILIIFTQYILFRK